MSNELLVNIEDSYVKNCVIQVREGDAALFVQKEGKVYARLDGYAVIPKEIYQELMRYTKSEA